MAKKETTKKTINPVESELDVKELGNQKNTSKVFEKQAQVGTTEVELPNDIVYETTVGINNKSDKKPKEVINVNNEPTKVWVKDWRELVEVEGVNQTLRGKEYYGIKR